MKQRGKSRADTRPRVDELATLARQKYPEKAYEYHWINTYAKMASRIIGWERTYSGYQQAYGLDVVLLFVNEEDHTTRSPAKKRAIQDWRNEGELVQSQTQTAAKG